MNCAVPARYPSYNLSDWMDYQTHREIDAIHALAIMLPEDGQAVNIGSGLGISTLSFLEERPQCKMWTVDIDKANSDTEFVRIKDLGYIIHRNIVGDSVEVGKAWDNGPLDWCFVDGDHSYKGCAGDITAWRPHMKKGGIMVFHDYNGWPVGHALSGIPWPDVKKAVDELMSDCEVILEVDRIKAFRI